MNGGAKRKKRERKSREETKGVEENIGDARRREMEL